MFVTTDELVGIRGWLAVLLWILFLLFYFTLRGAAESIQLYEQANGSGKGQPGVILLGCMNAMIAAVSAFLMLTVWSRKRNWPRRAMFFFIALFAIYAALMIWVLAFFDWSRSEAGQESLLSGLEGAATSACIVLYLWKSVRVQKTFTL